MLLTAVICCTVIILCVAILVARLTFHQKVVDEVFHVRPSTRLLCVGNSHTGCTWNDSDKEGVQVLWKSRMSIEFSVLRFRELARRHQLRRGVVCVVDCDATSIWGMSHEAVAVELREQLPLVWRYYREYVPYCSEVAIAAMRLLDAFDVQGTVPFDSHVWTSLSASEKRYQIEVMYGRPPENLFPDWKLRILSAAVEIRQICESRGAKLYLMASPLVSQNPQRHDGDLAELIDLLKSQGFDFIDFREVCDDADFRDAQHLSREGRLKFTSKWAKALVGGGRP